MLIYGVVFRAARPVPESHTGRLQAGRGRLATEYTSAEYSSVADDSPEAGSGERLSGPV